MQSNYIKVSWNILEFQGLSLPSSWDLVSSSAKVVAVEKETTGRIHVSCPRLQPGMSNPSGKDCNSHVAESGFGPESIKPTLFCTMQVFEFLLRTELSLFLCAVGRWRGVCVPAEERAVPAPQPPAGPFLEDIQKDRQHCISFPDHRSTHHLRKHEAERNDMEGPMEVSRAPGTKALRTALAVIQTSHLAECPWLKAIGNHCSHL
ncbi:uncharacterized protein LOC120892879 isoform X2 [Ictidomys tridecemlineatus]